MAKAWASVLTILWMAVAITGCQTPPPFEESQDTGSNVHSDVVKLKGGESITLTFVAAGSDRTFPVHEERIQADGNITPPDIGPIKAAGKTVGELQRDLQKAYDKLYKNFTVTVKAGDRFFTIDGEVKLPGPKPYLGDTDIIMAIAAGGGFTDFARQSKISLTRRNGQKLIVDYDRALEDKAYNPSVYPGDTIVVPRRFF